MSEQEKAEQTAAADTVDGGSSLIDQMLSDAKIPSSVENYGTMRSALGRLIAELSRTEGARVNAAAVDAMVAELDQRLSSQLDEIMHHPDFQRLEASWRGLKLLIDRTDFRENIKVELFNVSKDDLLNDFEDSPEVVKSGLYKHVYNSNYGVFGGEPVGTMIANYEFDHGPQDMKLLQYTASVAAMAHAPFVASASCKFFGIDSWLKLPNLKDLKAIFEAPQYAKWKSFRESEDSRYVGLTAPRFLLRLPYGSETVPVKEFNYEEKVTGAHDRYLWGNTAFAFATRFTDSFAKYRWCVNIIGPQGGGAVEDLPVHVYKETGAMEQKIPTEILITERREFELSEEGFISLVMRKGSDNACFFGANSCQKVKTFANTKEGKAAQTNYMLGTRLPYMFVINRMAHYIKVIQRENIGRSMDKNLMAKELNDWLKQYVAEMENPSAAVMARRPLREAQVLVEDVEGEPGWYRVDIRVRPHFKYEGAQFQLSLVGKLDKK
jgi:type VI secretion system protein ImpC